METSITNTKIRTASKDPQYFGSYFNMAAHNILIINNHMVDKLHLPDNKKLNDELRLQSSILTEEFTSNQTYAFKLTADFLPVAKVYDPEQLPEDDKEYSKKGLQLKEMSVGFKVCFSELYDFRNDYSHYYSKTNADNRKTKVSKELAEFLKDNFKRAIHYTKKRFSEVFKDADFKIAEERADQLVTDDNTITDFGMVFFSCLFLERQYAFLFMNKITGFKKTVTNEFEATREVFSAFCVNMPRDKFYSGDKKQAVLLDMINELNKCPKELFNSITADEKKQFQPDISGKKTAIEENSIPDDLPEEDYENYMQSITAKVRRSGRFGYFALRYLDESEKFNLRFHISLGRLCMKTYTKEVYGKIEEVNILKDINVFQRLKDFEFENENDENKYIKAIEEKCNGKFLQFAPHYNIENNKVALALNEKSFEANKGETKTIVTLPFPDAFLSVHELPKAVLLEILQPGMTDKLIRDFIKTNDEKIYNREFIEQIKKQLNYEKPFNRSIKRRNKPAYNEKSLEMLKRRICRLNEELKPHNLNHQQIPAKIAEYWLNINPVADEKVIAERIKAMVKDSKKRLKDIEKSKAPKIGEIADYIARDITSMIIDEESKKKINAFYFGLLQESLALFADEKTKHRLLDLCGKELDILNKEKGHPFLYKVNIESFKETPALYKKYLNEKLEWLEEKFYKKSRNKEGKKNTDVLLPKDLTLIPLTLKKLVKIPGGLDEWLKNVKTAYTGKENQSKPVDLPVNIFDKSIEDNIKSQLKKDGVSFNECDKFSRLLGLWLQGDTQPFYNASREYNVYDETVLFKSSEGAKFKDIFKDALNTAYMKAIEKRKEEKKSERRKPDINKSDILRVFNKAITENEKLIRFRQTQDRIMLLMINNTGLGLDNIKLKDIYPASGTTPLEKPVEIKQKAEGRLRTGKTVIKTITDKRKIKDYTVYKKFIHDKRLPYLFEYYVDETIEFEELKKQVDSYAKHRDFVFDRVFEVEKAIIQKSGAIDIIKTYGSHDNIQHVPYLEWLKNNNIIDDTAKEFLGEVRNAFSHNRFPAKDVVVKTIKLNNDFTIAKQIYEKYEGMITEIIERVS